MKSNKKSLLIRIITTPYRAMCKAKDLYIRSITDCANHPHYGMAAMSYQNPLSRSTSTASFGSGNTAAAEDLRELIRANSTARLGDLNITRADLELYIEKQHVPKQSSPAIVCRRVPRSVSVGMGRIDEDTPVSSSAGDDYLGLKVKSDHLSMFPKSRSRAVTSSIKLTRFS